MTGVLQPDTFPQVFGPRSTSRSTSRSCGQSSRALAEIEGASDRRAIGCEIAEGFLTIAVENMAAAIKKISIERGYDVGGYALVCLAEPRSTCVRCRGRPRHQTHYDPPARRHVTSAYGLGLRSLCMVDCWKSHPSFRSPTVKFKRNREWHTHYFWIIYENLSCAK